MQMGCLFVHMDNRREDVALADFLFHETDRFGEKGFNFLPLPAPKELRAGGDEGVHKHGAVLAGTASCRRDTVVNLLPVFVRGLDNVEIVPAAAGINVGIAGVLFFGALMVGFQRPGRPCLVLCEPQDCVRLYVRYLLFKIT